MAKAAKKNQTSENGSSSRKGKNGNGGGGKAAAEEKKKPTKPGAATEETTEAPAEKKRRGRAPTEGDPLKRVLIFLSDDDIAALKAEVGDRGMSTKIREIIKEYLAKRG